MSSLLIALLGVQLVPLFVASWRFSLVGLACQGLLMASIAYRIDPSMDTVDAWLQMFDLVVVRGIGAPLALYTVLHAQRTPARNDIIPANLMSWTIAIGMVFGAFRFGDLLADGAGVEHTFVAVATAGVLLGLLVLATQARVLSQMVAILRIENAIALFELSSKHGEPVGLRGVLTALMIATIGLFTWYLRTLPADEVSKTLPGDGPP